MSKILLVEDEDAFRMILKQMLERDGHTVLPAANGRKALRLCIDGGIDLVVTDIVMPDMEGLETIREIRKQHPALKVIAMSGGGRIGAEDYLRIAGKLGADQTLVKPFSRTQLRAAISGVLPD